MKLEGLKTDGRPTEVSNTSWNDAWNILAIPF